MTTTEMGNDIEVEQRIENPEEIWLGIDGQYNLTLSEALALAEWWDHNRGSKKVV